MIRNAWMRLVRLRFAYLLVTLLLAALLVAALLVAGLLGGGSLLDGRALVRDGQSGNDLSEKFPAGARAGQSLVARLAGLQGFRVYVTDAPPGSRLELTLYASPERRERLGSASADVNGRGWVRFDFSPLADSQGRDYYFDLAAPPEGALSLGAAPGDSYLDGAAYRDGAPLDAQLAFRLSYHPAWASLGLLALGWQWALILGGALLLFAAPGWAVGSLLLPSWTGLSFIEKVILAAGTGLGLYPVLFLLARQASIAPGPAAAWGPGFLSLAWLGGRFAWQQARSARRPEVETAAPPRGSGAGRGYRLLLLAVLVALVFSRFWAVRAVDVPLWGDAVSHTTTTRLFLDQGAVPHNWLPYEPYETFTVQWGFSLAAALLSWLVGLTDLQSVLYTGQLANILAVLGLLPLARRMAGDSPLREWAGLGAVLAAGFLLIYPAHYVNWGRYAQLSGQAILPAALWLAWDLFDRAAERPSWSQAALLGAVVTGMTLHYYRMAFFFASFALAIWLLTWLPRHGRSLQAWKSLALSAALAGGVALALFAPWLGQMQGATLAETAASGPATGDRAASVYSDYGAWKDTYYYYPDWQVNLGLLGLAWAVLRRRWAALAFGLGMAILAAVPAMALVGLPAASFMSSFSALIFLYAPVALFFGLLFADAVVLAQRWRPGPALVGTLVVAVLLWGGREMARMVRLPEHAIGLRPDVRAAAWIAANLPADGRLFLAEAYWYPTYSSVVGADGGWWLPVLAGRRTTVPVQYPLLNDRPFEPDYTSRIYTLTRALLAAPLGDETVRAALCALDVGYAYVGQHKGPGPGVDGDPLLFTADELTGSGWFEPVYAHDRVKVYQLRPGVCP